jgi:4-amino-4-deoxy-L-arabinose transferase-like glycosyltransferase
LLYFVIKQISDKKTALLASLIFYSMPLVIINSGSSNVELAMVFYGLLSFGTILDWIKTKDINYLFLGSLFAGTTFAIKLPGFAIITSFFLFVVITKFIFIRELSSKLNIKSLLLCGIICVSAFFPWLVRNFIVTGNPIYPFQKIFFKGDSRFVLENLDFRIKKYKKGFNYYLRKNLDFHFGDIDQSGGAFIFTFLVISLVIYNKFFLKEKLYIIFGLINFFILYFLLTLPETRFEYRYYLFSYTLFCGGAAIIIKKLKEIFVKEKLINVIIIFMLLVPSTFMSIYFAQKRFLIFFDSSKLENYFQDKMPEYDVVKFLQKFVSKEKNVVCVNVGSLKQYYFENKVFMLPVELEWRKNLKFTFEKLKRDNMNYLVLYFNPRVKNIEFYKELKFYSDQNFNLIYQNQNYFLYEIF